MSQVVAPLMDLDVRIEPRRLPNGNPFTEVFYTWTENGQVRHALTRLWYALTDSPHARAAERAAFLRRRRHQNGE
jgi:hypothetical protein